MAKNKPSQSTGSERFTDTRRVKDLIALMAENGLTEIELVEDKSRIVLRRGTVSGSGVAQTVHHAAPVHHSAPAAHNAPPAATPNAEDDLIPIKSPMVGTFYSSPNPESDPFLSVGTQVQKDKTVVCIIEAMKVFNEIHAEVSGTVVKVLVSNGQVVEFGQPMFMVKPN